MEPIGNETAKTLNIMGAKLTIADFNIKGAEEVAHMLSRSGAEAKAYQIDVSKTEEVEKMIDWTANTFGTLNGIFNNAGIGLVKSFLEMDPKSYLKVIEVDQQRFF